MPNLPIIIPYPYLTMTILSHLSLNKLLHSNMLSLLITG